MAVYSIGIDLGGTQMRAGLVQDGNVRRYQSRRVNNQGSMEEVLQELFELTDAVAEGKIEAIGLGVPSVVDIKRGIVYDVQNIPSWKEVHLKQCMEERYGVPVFVNNDSNCFALAEWKFGKGKGTHSMVGITIGTGLGGGIIINNQLYTGANCGAGEFGMVKYLDRFYEYYASGQFFTHVYRTDGWDIFQQAKNGNENALHIYREFGHHLGEAIKMILYTYDPELIVIGGSIKDAWSFYEAALWEVVNTFVYPRSVSGLKIEQAELEHSGILGASLLKDQLAYRQ
jgi:glucokinase